MLDPSTIFHRGKDILGGMEEIMYWLYLLENIRRGQQDATQGKITPVDDVLREIDTW